MISLGALTAIAVLLAQIPSGESQGAKLYRGGPRTTIYTPGDGQWHTWYSVQDRRHFFFQVRVCSSAHIALSDYAGNVTSESIEIVLGSDDNSGSQIRHPHTESTLFHTYTPDILHCDDFRTFWIRWVYDYIEVGYGNIAGYEKFMNFLEPRTSRFNSIGIRSGYSHAATWRIHENSGHKLMITTVNNYFYNTLWKDVRDRDFFNFGVRACGDVHLILTQHEGSMRGKVYEFVIGGWSNTAVAIRTYLKAANAQVKRELAGVLACDEFRHFYISWVNGTTEIGYGNMMRGDDTRQTTIVQWVDPEPLQVGYLGITTGWENTGYWSIDDDLETNTFLVTQNTSTTDSSQRYNATWIDTPRKAWFTFEVEGCAEANIYLSDIPSVSGYGCEVAIGANSNTRTGIRTIGMSGFLSDASTPNILNCFEPHTFWISWFNNTIRVGRGSVYPHNELVPPYTFGIQFPINAIGLATPGQYGLWRFREDTGERMRFYAPALYTSFQTIWRSTRKVKHVTFQVKVCSDVHFGMSPTYGLDYDDWYYDMIIGGWTNTQSLFKQWKGGESRELTDFLQTPGLLQCDRFVDLWVSWYDNHIMAGRGDLLGQRIFLEYKAPARFPVMAVSYSNGWGFNGEFRFEEDLGDYLVYFTNQAKTEGQYPYWVAIDRRVSATTFRMRACRDAVIYLSSTVGDLSGKNYQIVIGSNDGARCEIKDSTGAVRATKDHATDKWIYCDDNTDFYLSWDQGVVTLRSNDTEIVTWNSQDVFSIAALTFTTPSGVDGQWRWYANVADWTSFSTPVDFGYDYAWKTVEHRQNIVFDVTACSDVHVMLSERFYYRDSGYEIVIGGWENSRSVIRVRVNWEWTNALQDVIAINTVSYLDCNERRFFWLSWEGGVLRVGRGSQIGVDRFMDYHPMNMLDIKAIAFSTGYNYKGKFNIPLLDYYLSTPPPATEEPIPPEGAPSSNGWMSAGAIVGIIFGVMCSVMIVVLIVLIVLDRRNPIRSVPTSMGRQGRDAIVSDEYGPDTTAAEAPSSSGKSAVDLEV